MLLVTVHRAGDRCARKQVTLDTAFGLMETHHDRYEWKCRN